MRISVALVVMVGCSGGESPIEEVTVSGIREPCLQFEAAMCLRMVSATGTERTSSIEGFEPRWGIDADVRFHREQVEPVPDGPSELLILDEIVEERPSGFTEIPLGFPSSAPGVSWFSGDQSPLLLSGITAVTCDDAVCSAILEASQSGAAFTVTAEVLGDEHLRAIAVQ